jgi:tetratricopeptide (TPR) repeat protein
MRLRDANVSYNIDKAVSNQKLALEAGEKGNLEESLRYIKIAIKHDKKNSISYFIKGRLLWELLDYKFSLIAFKKCISLDKSNRTAKLYIGLLYLTLENFEKGCQYYGYRHDLEIISKFEKIKGWAPREQFGEVIIWAEQGIGDEIMFYQFLPFLKGMDFKFTLECDHRLHSALSVNFPWINLVRRDEKLDLSKFDFQFPSGDLLKHFYHNIDQLKHSAIEVPLNHEVNTTLRNYDNLEKSFIGISWLSISADHGVTRSLEIENLCNHLDPTNHIIVNLQYLAPPEELSKVRDLGFEVIDEFDCYKDISAVFALIKSCSRVITIDNSVAHFAGALGVDTQVWLPKIPNWRWGVDKQSSYFYRSVSLHYID